MQKTSDFILLQLFKPYQLVRLGELVRNHKGVQKEALG